MHLLLFIQKLSSPVFKICGQGTCVSCLLLSKAASTVVGTEKCSTNTTANESVSDSVLCFLEAGLRLHMESLGSLVKRPVSAPRPPRESELIWGMVETWAHIHYAI